MIKYFEESLDAINNAVKSLDEVKFNNLVEDCVQALEKGRKIVASGLGKNVPICEKFVGTLLSLGQSANFMHTSSAVHGDLGMISSGDIVILLTKSGNTQESVYLGDILLRKDITIWLLTFESCSALATKIEKQIVLQLEDEGDPWNIVPNNSSTVNLIILQGLALSIAQKRGVSLNDFKQNHPGGSIGEQLKNV